MQPGINHTKLPPKAASVTSLLLLLVSALTVFLLLCVSCRQCALRDAAIRAAFDELMAAEEQQRVAQHVHMEHVDKMIELQVSHTARAHGARGQDDRAAGQSWVVPARAAHHFCVSGSVTVLRTAVDITTGHPSCDSSGSVTLHLHHCPAARPLCTVPPHLSASAGLPHRRP